MHLNPDNKSFTDYFKYEYTIKSLIEKKYIKFTIQMLIRMLILHARHYKYQR